MYLGAPIKAKEENKEQDDNSNNSFSGPVKPKKINEYRLPKDIGPGLLKFCLTHSDSPNLKETKLEDRDPKDYEWLKEAFSNLEDDAKKMKRLMEIFEDKPENREMKKEEREKKYITSLETLIFYIEDLDNSGDLIKIGGAPVLINLLNSTNEQVRAISAQCLSTMAQSEPTIQNYFTSLGLLEICIKILNKETKPFCREKFLSLISSLLSYDMGSIKIDKSTLVNIVQLTTSFLSPTVELTIKKENTNDNNNNNNSEETITVENGVSGISKACFLLNKLIIAFPELKEAAFECGSIDGLIGLIKAFNLQSNPSHTQVVMVEKVEISLLTFLKDDKSKYVIEQCKAQNLLIEIEKRLKSLNTENNSDEIDILNNIKKLLK
ncbi:hypothetical protein DICPUDRAFT_157066 [Dictyostelium purpureum]|uniref:Nucleotide exchange factor Fes1 domain-containing protein n=1 Tax=Dictyostelium purpureum TaxID=5786 RepID=F0ZY63_DICPU|nr:uncharacterized protein DICPUDRAFT_157066 [Dictyostelium purpureum]EGC31107.1 hypothetical protein DICPUDRAFT_157066 [Dictyostelium purpureum]|eukprot:XP_003292356.1 hypothetical protein DICPUDRAFT_157066 [Dictyostelium purpureum]